MTNFILGDFLMEVALVSLAGILISALVTYLVGRMQYKNDIKKSLVDVNHQIDILQEKIERNLENSNNQSIITHGTIITKEDEIIKQVDKLDNISAFISEERVLRQSNNTSVSNALKSVEDLRTFILQINEQNQNTLSLQNEVQELKAELRKRDV